MVWFVLFRCCPLTEKQPQRSNFDPVQMQDVAGSSNHHSSGEIPFQAFDRQ